MEIDPNKWLLNITNIKKAQDKLRAREDITKAH